MENILLIDADFLCHRSAHIFNAMNYKGKPTGVIFGFFASLYRLLDQFQPERVVICFDHHDSFRERLYPDYKITRRKKREKEPERYRILDEQRDALRSEILHSFGFPVAWSQGLEADDLLAVYTRYAATVGNSITLVTADEDMYQLLKYRNTVMWNPQSRNVISAVSFATTYGIHSDQWHIVKAVAGCPTDDVPGVKGIGELTMCRFLNGEMSGTRKTKQITEFMEGPDYQRNLKLVTLPFAQDTVGYDVKSLPALLSSTMMNRSKQAERLRTVYGMTKL
jgi:DNA polymerase I